MRRAGRVVGQVLQLLSEHVKAGVTTQELDEIAYKFIRDQGAIPTFKGYHPYPSIQPFPGTICASVNEQIVHGIPGDRVLKEVAARLKNCVRKADTVARIGGDEFVVMLPMRDAQHAALIAEAILAALAEPFVLGANQFQIGASIGISVFPEDAMEKDELLKYADRAMYAVKASGRNSYRFYTREEAQAQAQA